MKKLVLSLLCAGAMSIPATASALDSFRPFNVLLVNGPSVNHTIPLGTMFFDLDADIVCPAASPCGAVLRGCRYFVEWDNFAFMPISAEGFIVESKAHGMSSCFQNASRPITALVVNDGLFFGFDRFSQFRQVANLIAAEDLFGNISGLVVYGAGGAPSAMANSILIQPA